MKLVSFRVVALILVKGIFTTSFDDQDGYSILCSVPGPKSIELTNSDSCESPGNSSSVLNSSSYRNFHAFSNYHEHLCAQISSMSLHRIVPQMQENTYNFVKHQQKLDEQIKLFLEMTTADMREFLDNSGLNNADLIGKAELDSTNLNHFTTRQHSLDLQIKKLQAAEMKEYLEINELFEAGLAIKTEKIKEEMKRNASMVEAKVIFAPLFANVAEAAATSPVSSVPSETITSPASNFETYTDSVSSSDEYSSSSDVTPILLTGNLSPIDGISFKIPSIIISGIEANQLSPRFCTFDTSTTTNKRPRSSGNEFLKPTKKRISE